MCDSFNVALKNRYFLHWPFTLQFLGILVHAVHELWVLEWVKGYGHFDIVASVDLISC